MIQSKQSPKNIHFVGIGGSGMSGLAEVLHNSGYIVTGSDILMTSITDRLISLGIKIEKNHNPLNISSAEMIVVSSAIDNKNLEVEEAKRLSIPVLARAELLSSLMNMKRGIAVAGSHGKTTTTSILASIMTEAMLDPTFVTGGILKSFSSNAKLGTGNYLIAEADESDKSFLMLHPSLEIITNIGSDHLPNYENNIKNLEKAFIGFVKKLPFNGLAVVCGDDPIISELIPSFSRQVITYGFKNSNDYVIKDFIAKGLSSEFSVNYKGDNLFKAELNLPGKHNALNAVAASVLAIYEGISIINVQAALKKFSGISRRMEFLGEINNQGHKTILIDDYGHHPTEIKSTIEAIKDSFPNKEIKMVFQPHRFSRTKSLYKEFIEVLHKVDEILLLEIYPAGEQEIKGINSKNLINEIKKRGHKKISLGNSETQILSFLEKASLEGGVLLIQGAGDISNISKKIVKRFNVKSE